MCDATPPYFVIKPLIPFVKIHSYPGSALGIITILSIRSSSVSSSRLTTSPSTFLEVIKLGRASLTGITETLVISRITSGKIAFKYLS